MARAIISKNIVVNHKLFYFLGSAFCKYIREHEQICLKPIICNVITFFLFCVRFTFCLLNFSIIRVCLISSQYQHNRVYISLCTKDMVAE